MIKILKRKSKRILGSNEDILEKKRGTLNESEWKKALIGNLSVSELEKKIKANNYPVWITPLIKNTKSGDSVLELGSGTGELSAILSLHGRKLTLLDFSKENLNFAKELFASLSLHAKFVQHDILEELPFPDNSFDWVFSSGLLEHFTDEQIIFILNESKRVCKNGVMSLVPNANSMPYMLGKYILETENKWTYGYEKPKATMRGYYEECGFRDVFEETTGTYHALNFLDEDIANVFDEFYKSLDIEELNQLKQGYLVFTCAKR